jgi:putative spermidine/putrescine transport system substrate-binding protein
VTTDDVTKRAVTAPNSFDLIDTEYFSLKKIVPTGNLKGIDTSASRTPTRSPRCSPPAWWPARRWATRARPRKVIYLEGPRARPSPRRPPEFMTDPDHLQRRHAGHPPRPDQAPDQLLGRAAEPEFKGKAAILNIPSIGIMDAAMVVEAMGMHKYRDKGNMTKQEIDLTIKTLIEAKKAGQFRALWKDFNESVNLMASGEVVIQSMWSPAVTAVRTRASTACSSRSRKATAPGRRALACRHAQRQAPDAAYEFINWFLDGWAGAYLNRQGYYSAVLDTAKAKMEAYEWAYWMEGKPAAKDIKSPHGDVLAKAGSVRDGGSYEQRMGGIACWNSVMDENAYMVQKWNEFVAA